MPIVAREVKSPNKFTGGSRFHFGERGMKEKPRGVISAAAFIFLFENAVKTKLKSVVQRVCT